MAAAALFVAFSCVSARASADVLQVQNLYDEDVTLEPSLPADSPRHAASVTGIRYYSSTTPCLMELRVLPLLDTTIQAGASCAVQTGRSHAMTVDVYPEIAYQIQRNALGTAFRPAMLGGLTESLQLSDTVNGEAVFGSFRYKFAPDSDREPPASQVTSGYNPRSLQKWADVLESNFSLGWIYHEKSPGEHAQLWAMRVFYMETLPLELRRVGSLENSGAVQIKTVDVSVRRAWDEWIIGGGLGYAVLAIDSARLAFPYPTLYFSRQW